jgi:hypothetical protein
MAAAASESMDGVAGATPLGTAATANPPPAPYCCTSGSSDDGIEKRT